ncbi:MAG: hypothetical protein R3E01_11100 [Pirellulaceae bacterium]
MATNAALATLDHVWGVLEPMGHSLALMGGLSLAAWNYIRATRDVDLLIDDDDVVGNYVTSDGVRHGFIRSQGSYTQLKAADSPRPKRSTRVDCRGSFRRRRRGFPRAVRNAG